MSMNEVIIIEIQDRIDSGILSKLRDIAAYSISANTAIDKLAGQQTRAALSAEKLFQAEARSTAALDNMRAASTRVMTEEEKLSAASLKGALAAERLFQAEARSTTELEKLTAAQIRSGLAQEQLTQSKIRSAIASEQLTQAQNKTLISAELVKQAQTKTAIMLQKLAQAQANVTTAQTKGAIASQNLATATTKTAIAGQRLVTATNTAAASSARLANAQIRLQNATVSTGQSFSFLTGVFGKLAALAATVFGVRQIIDFANESTLLGNKLLIVSDSQQQTNTLMTKLFEIANRARVPVEDITTAFQRYDMALKPLGTSQADVLKMTETIAKAMTLSGASVSESAQALRQLSQAFNKGKLDGDEFRTVMETAPILSDALGLSLKVTRGELLKLAPEGKITALVMEKAFLSLSQVVDEKFGKTVPTIAQSFAVLKNNMIQAFGDLERQTGVFSKLSAGIIQATKDFAFLTETAITTTTTLSNLFATLGVMTGAGESINFLQRTLQGVNLILAVVVDAFSALVFVIDKIAQAVTYAAASFVEFFVGAGSASDSLYEWSDAYGYWGDEVRKGGSALDKAIDSMTDWEYATKNASSSTEDLRKKNEELRKEAERLEKIAAGKKAAESRAKDLKKINAELDKELVMLKLLEPDRAIYNKMTEMEIQFAQKHSPLRAKELQDLRKKQEAVIKGAGAQKEMDRVYSEAIGPQQKYQDSLTAIEKLETRKAISAYEAARQLNLANREYEFAKDPMKKFTDSLKDELSLIGLTDKEMEIQTRLLQVKNEMTEKGLPLNQKQIQGLENYFRYAQYVNAINTEMNRIESESVGAKDQLINKMTAVNMAIEAGIPIVGGYNAALGQLALDYANLQVSLGQADFSTFIDASLGSVVEGYQGVIIGLKNAWGDFFTTFTDGFSKSIGQAIVMGDSLEESLTRVSQQALAGLISALVKLGIQYAMNAALQTSVSAAALTATTTASVAAAKIMAAAWAPAAAATSLASFGANSPVAIEGMAVAFSAAEVMAMMGFKDGGYTGDFGVNSPAGIVHGKEFVVNAPATARNRPILEAMNRGESLGSASVGTSVSVKIENYGTSKQFEVQKQDDGNIRIIARDEAAKAIRREVPSLVSSEIANPNSSVSKSLDRNTTTGRRR